MSETDTTLRYSVLCEREKTDPTFLRFGYVMLAASTRVRRKNEETFAIRFRALEFLLVHSDGTFTLTPGDGAIPIVICRRLERFAPVQKFEADSSVVLFGLPVYIFSPAENMTAIRFRNGMRIDSEGCPLAPHFCIDDEDEYGPIDWDGP